MAGCGADTDANVLIGTLTTDAVFPIPNPDLSGITFPDEILNQTINPPTVESITTGAVDGPGVFDVLMRGFKAHLQEEFDAGRITGDDYTKSYISLTEAAMNQGITFLLGKDNAFWQAQLGKIQAFTARVQFEETKIRVAATQYDASNQKATYALTKLRMSNESANYCINQYNLDNILPSQKAKLLSENRGLEIANQTADYARQEMQPIQKQVLDQQRVLLEEQSEAQRAQTMDTRTNGLTITGVLGKQKDLYAQQITSYQRDSELKVAKVFSDSWITQKTIDEGLVPPNSFTNAEIEKVMVQLRQKASIGI